MKIELVYEKTCPNIDAAREQLRSAFAQVGLEPSWDEWEVSDASAPDRVRIHGSPTILIDGRDVSGLAPGDCNTNCRIYPDKKGVLRTVPSVERIVKALGF
jgi:mercuric ion transport protein